MKYKLLKILTILVVFGLPSIGLGYTYCRQYANYYQCYRCHVNYYNQTYCYRLSGYSTNYDYGSEYGSGYGYGYGYDYGYYPGYSYYPGYYYSNNYYHNNNYYNNEHNYYHAAPNPSHSMGGGMMGAPNGGGGHGGHK